MKCPLCSSHEIKVSESINRKDIVNLWQQNGVNVEEEIKTHPVNKYRCKNCGLSFFDPQNAGGDKFYSKLGEYDWYYLHPGKTEYDYVQNVIKENDFILDIGAGRGELFNRIKKEVHYTGLELSTKAVELAKESGINVLNEDLLVHAENNKERYDIVCLFQVLEHLTELNNFIHAIKKCLKPGGHLCIAVPNNDGFLRYVTNNAFNMPPHHTLLWNKQSLEYLGTIFGLKVIDIHLEKLQDVHKDWFVNALLQKKMRGLLGRKHHTVNFSFSHGKISGAVNRVRKVRIFETMIKKTVLSKERNGHSIIVVYQKVL